ncbi:MAG TPA: hypothetical protein VMW72_03190 [Sedimentisphaerales bacterium]|nr:hypothetical protein [Sedimentisphaerales bacterium]
MSMTGSMVKAAKMTLLLGTTTVITGLKPGVVAAWPTCLDVLEPVT